MVRVLVYTLVSTLIPALVPALPGGSARAEPLDRLRQDSPYRLHLRPGDYQLQLPGEAPAAAASSTAPGATPAVPPGPAGFAGLIDRHAKAHGLDPGLVHAVVRAESAYRPGAVSPRGAVGLMQVMPATGRRFGILDLKNPEGNLRAGTAYLSYLLGLFRDLPLALAAYNAGEGAVLRHGRQIPPYPETRAYVQGILNGYGRSSNPRPDASPYRLRRDLWRERVD